MIWIVEDHQKIRARMTLQLEDEGFEVKPFDCAEPVRDALLESPSNPPELLILDVRLPGLSGVELVSLLSKRHRLPPTIILSGEASISETVDAIKMGVYDFLEKPVGRERLLHTIRNCLEINKLRQHVKALESQKSSVPAILGASPALETLREQIERVGPTEGRVLIRGESGTGKELVAAHIHATSARRAQPLVKINCAAIPAHLIEDELFGHVRGAFTDARHDKPGVFEQAHRGTLFLDEIGDMAMELQARLLRVLEDGVIRRIGDVRDRQVDVRVLAATHCDLEAAVREGRFREDLFFRLSALPLEVPPLRQRPGDVPLLFTHFVDQACQKHNIPDRTVDEKVLAALERHTWPGNIRELKNVAERMVIFGGEPLTLDHLPSSLNTAGLTPPSTMLQSQPMARFLSLKDFKRNCEREYLDMILQHTGWNISQAARILDIKRTYLHQKLVQHELKRPE